MHLNWIAFAIPLFLGLMWLEYRLSGTRRGEVFHFPEAVANLNVGIAERLSDLFTTGMFFFVFDWIHRHYALFDIHPGFFTWILLFLFTDLLWYFYHRFGHEVNLLWAAHVVHHQSEDYNFTVSARITIFQALARGIFWSFLPLIGFPAEMIAIFLLIHGAYPFFTHTQLVGKLGWIEKIFVTPSHHRVHHSSNPEYLDKNYGDVLIIWDKLFGTFAEEDAKPVYGLTKPLNSHSFLWQHFHFTLELFIQVSRTPGNWRKMKVLFGRPDDIDPGIRGELEQKLSNRNASISASARLKDYIFFQTVITLVSLFLTALFSWHLTGWQLLLAAAFILTSVINTGAMLEQRSWVFYLEYIRICLLSFFLFTFNYGRYPGWGMLMLATIILFFFNTANERYKSLVYGT
jgi:alkylglycerol monooxygenase